jgi:hypothetical protein
MMCAKKPTGAMGLVWAASNPNSAVLEGLLAIKEERGWGPSEWEPMNGGRREIPPRTAIQAQLVENVRLLLSHGADPNDYD